LSDFRRSIEAGEVPLEMIFQDPSTYAVEIVAAAGYDSIAIDLQHTAVDLGQLSSLLALLKALDVHSVVRVPDNSHALLTRVLDAGPNGVICPDVETAEEVEEFVSACRYPPQGTRSFGPMRGLVDHTIPKLEGKPQFSVEETNRDLFVIAQIESPRGLENADEIAAVEGLDALMPGPMDYSLSAYGELIPDHSDPRAVQSLEAIAAAAHGAGKLFGLLIVSPDHIPSLLEKTKPDWVMNATDLGWLKAVSSAAVAAGRQAVAEYKQSTKGHHG
jgi:4-hydroxy-2-oxoheptanedioate aldolase